MWLIENPEITDARNQGTVYKEMLETVEARSEEKGLSSDCWVWCKSTMRKASSVEEKNNDLALTMC